MTHFVLNVEWRINGMNQARKVYITRPTVCKILGSRRSAQELYSDLLQACQTGTFVSCEFSAEGALISASAIPHNGGRFPPRLIDAVTHSYLVF